MTGRGRGSGRLAYGAQITTVENSCTAIARARGRSNRPNSSKQSAIRDGTEVRGARPRAPMPGRSVLQLNDREAGQLVAWACCASCPPRIRAPLPGRREGSCQQRP